MDITERISGIQSASKKGILQGSLYQWIEMTMSTSSHETPLCDIVCFCSNKTNVGDCSYFCTKLWKRHHPGQIPSAKKATQYSLHALSQAVLNIFA